MVTSSDFVDWAFLFCMGMNCFNTFMIFIMVCDFSFRNKMRDKLAAKRRARLARIEEEEKSETTVS